MGAIEHWLPRFDVMVIGPGLGRDAWVHATVVKVGIQVCVTVSERLVS